MFHAIGSFIMAIWPYLLAVLAFVLLIIIHEFGHFIAAKSLGVRVNEFALGFGPTLFSKQGKETKYAVHLIPFGGYCAMEGEDEDSTDERAFCRKSPWRRFLIIIMGAVFNLLLGVIIVAITLIPTKSNNGGKQEFNSTTIGGFHENASSQKSGLKVGDEIIAVDGRKIYTTYDLSYTFTNVNANGKLDITVKRDGKKIVLNNVTFATKKIDKINMVTVDFWVQPTKITFSSYISQTIKTSISYGRVVMLSLIDLVTGKYGISAVSGPVGVTAAIGHVAKSGGAISILPIVALLTINLGLFNLLPLPALDGGRVVFILIEMIARKPVPQKYEGWIHATGFILLLGFLILITAKDIWGLISGLF